MEISAKISLDSIEINLHRGRSIKASASFKIGNIPQYGNTSFPFTVKPDEEMNKVIDKLIELIVPRVGEIISREDEE